MSRAGTCKYCKQLRLVKDLPPLPEGATYDDFDEELLQQMYDNEATRNCDCEEAKKEREREKAAAASDEALEALTGPDDYLKDILAAARNKILMHPEFKGISLKVVDPVSAQQRVYKLKTDKDDNVIATRTDTSSTADIVN